MSFISEISSEARSAYHIYYLIYTQIRLFFGKIVYHYIDLEMILSPSKIEYIVIQYYIGM